MKTGKCHMIMMNLNIVPDQQPQGVQQLIGANIVTLKCCFRKFTYIQTRINVAAMIRDFFTDRTGNTVQTQISRYGSTLKASLSVFFGRCCLLILFIQNFWIITALQYLNISIYHI